MENGIIRTVIKLGVIDTLEDLLAKTRNLRELGYKIGFTSGTWDLLHEGHIFYIRDAASRVDVLILGVDTDDWVKERNKGPNRPIVKEAERIEILKDYQTVSGIVRISSFDQTHISFMDVLSGICPDVLVISTSTPEIDDRFREMYTKHCGELVNLQRKSVITTTSRIRDRMIEGKGELANDLKIVADTGLTRIHEAVESLALDMQNLVKKHIEAGGGE